MGRETTGRAQPDYERKTGFEPATLSLARRYSTTEPLPPVLCLLQCADSVGDERLELSRVAPVDPKSTLSANSSNRPLASSALDRPRGMGAADRSPLANRFIAPHSVPYGAVGGKNLVR